MPPRRIAFVNSLRDWGGAEIWMLDAAAGLRDRGHLVDVVAQPQTPLLQRARAAGFDTAAIPIRFDAAPWTLAKLWRLFRRRRTDAVLCNLTKDLKAAGVAARLAGVRCVLALRESDFPLKDKLYYRGYFNRVASGVVVNSEATRATVAASAPWLEARRVHLLYKWVDTQRFAPAPERPASIRVAFLGQLIERKGLRMLMAAWSRIDSSSSSRPVSLHLAGSGPLEAEVLAWRDRLRSPGAVRLEGWVEDPASFLRRMSMLVMPSTSEGFGLSAAEASACALPVVATRCSSLPEIVVDGRTGLLVEPGDDEALAAAVLEIADGGAVLGRRLGEAGRRRVVERFGRDRGLDRLEALIGGGDGDDAEKR